MRPELEPRPPQPPKTAWTFVDELRTTPYHRKVNWPERAPKAGEAVLRGLRLDPQFPDPHGLLQTAYADFDTFLAAAGARKPGAARLVTHAVHTPAREAFRVEVAPGECRLGAAGAEGIRRGLVWIEDEMLRRGGPFLPLGVFEREPLVRTRVSRCFYGPVNRPPHFRDELADDVDYYPEEYLNRLAHEGVNGLWLTIHFFNTVPSRIIPQYGRNAAPRLEKLRRVVAKCRRYGIRIYPFCIEPAAFTWPYPEVADAAAAHPDLIGHAGSFCVSAPKGRDYLIEATRTLFSEVPDLDGLMLIPVGERQTHCWSLHADKTNTCPRCSKRQPWEVLAETLSLLEQGMRGAAPEAELIAWPYGQSILWGKEQTIAAAGHMPKGVVLQHNFETGGHNVQLGKRRPTWDYWLSYTGPSSLFRACARAARAQGVRVAAKLQVSCSHEVATTQVVPAPGLLYRKYDQMRRLGVTGAMHSWYFGAYPSLMTKAAAELSFAPFPASEEAFLLSLARRDWGRHAPQVARAWRFFQKGYSQYPTAHMFGYYGPMHDGVAWPLYLVPRRLPLAPTWQTGYARSGDYIAECVTNGFTLEEMLVLCERMAGDWSRGARILERLKPRFRSDPDRLRDIGVATALGLQFQSGYNILRFYALRERLADAKTPPKRAALLKDMKAIACAEIRISEKLLPLARADSRLGFHSEAEGYKYHPALLQWRIRQLRRLLRTEFPAVEKQARQEGPLFPGYTGPAPGGLAYACPAAARSPAMMGLPQGGAWNTAPEAECAHWLAKTFNKERWRKCGYDGYDHAEPAIAARQGRSASWKALRAGDTLYVGVVARNDPALGAGAQGGNVEVVIEPSRTLPRVIFRLSADGACSCVKDDGYIPRGKEPWRCVTHRSADGWSATLRIPLLWLTGRRGPGRPPLRVNVVHHLPAQEKEGDLSCSWAKRVPVQGRLAWGNLNPAADFGWLVFEPAR